jgi:hypothetical protein
MVVAGFCRTTQQRQILNRFLNSTRGNSVNRALSVLRDSIKTNAKDVHRYSRMSRYDLSLFVKNKARGCLESDGIQHNLHLQLRDTATLKKRASGVCAVYLEAILRGIAVSQTPIVQDRGAAKEKEKRKGQSRPHKGHVLNKSDQSVEKVNLQRCFWRLLLGRRNWGRYKDRN